MYIDFNLITIQNKYTVFIYNQDSCKWVPEAQCQYINKGWINKAAKNGITNLFSFIVGWSMFDYWKNSTATKMCIFWQIFLYAKLKIYIFSKPIAADWFYVFLMFYVLKVLVFHQTMKQFLLLHSLCRCYLIISDWIGTCSSVQASETLTVGSP